MGLSCLQFQSQPQCWPHPEAADDERRQKGRDTGLLDTRAREISESWDKSHDWEEQLLYFA